MENVSLQFQRGIIMEKQNWKFYWKWSVFVLMTMICLLSFYKSYQNVKYELQEESQTLFQRAVQDDTNSGTYPDTDFHWFLEFLSD